MHPIAVLITEDNIQFFINEIEYVLKNINIKNSKIQDWGDMYLVVTEDGPDLISPYQFHSKYIFTRPYTPAMAQDYQRIVECKGIQHILRFGDVS